MITRPGLLHPDVVGIDLSGNPVRKARQAERDKPFVLRYLHADVATPEFLIRRGR